MNRCFLPVPSVLLCLSAQAAPSAPNLFPEPGFETSGTTEAARSGKRAGVMVLKGSKGWHAMEHPSSIPVEAFATYRAEGWVKGTAEGGALLALYAYGWNSYGWWFMRQVRVPNTNDWRKVSTTFSVPADRVTFHPLVSSDCRNVEAYVDDVSITRVKSAAETIAALRAKPNPSSEERMLLARWLLAQDDAAGAEKLMDGGDDGSKADISCLLAQRAADKADRTRRIVDMIRHNCIRWPDAHKRLRELTANLSAAERARLCLDALTRTKGAGFAVKAADLVLSLNAPSLGSRAVAELDADLTEADKLVTEAADKGHAEAVAGFRAKLVRMRVELEERKASLGSARLFIAGQWVIPETYRIVVSAEATPQEVHAARELRAHLEMLTGYALDVVPDGSADWRTPIVVGKSALLAERGIEIDFEGLGVEGIRMLVDGKALVLTGNTRGVLYAVYTFLEEYCECRWFTADCTRIPREGTFRIPRSLDVTYVPPFEYRDTDYPTCRAPGFGVRNKLNGLYSHANETWGGSIKYRGFVHTFGQLVPPEEHFAAHPEYYSEIDGVRLGPDHSQLCLTNPEVTRIATQTVRRWMRESPHCQIISVSQNDWHNYCTCANCEALAEKEGSQAGPLLHFVNAIADAVRDERPDLIIDTLAYQYTRKPPKLVKPRPNVAVRLCSIECCFVHPLDGCPFNRTFVDDIKGWNAICDRLHIWDYVINYAHTIQPFPNLRVLKPNIRFFRDHGVTGIYEEANYFSKGGELAELRTYVMAKLLWDPDADPERAVDEFAAAYYGPAAKHVARYLELVHDRVCSERKRHVRIYTPPNAYLNDDRMLSKAEKLFDRAEAAVAGDEKLLHRVRVARMPIQYTRLALGRTAFRLKGDAFVAESSASAELLDRFAATGRSEGVTHVREGRQGGFDAWVNRMRSAHRPVKLLRLHNGHLEAALIPDLGARVWSVTHLGTGREIVRQFGDAESGWRPSEGGFEEYSTTGYRAPGWSEAYKVVESGESFAVLEAGLSNGFSLRRRVELPADRSELMVTSSLVNSSGAARDGQFRLHPAFGVADTAKASIWLKGATGWTERSLANPEDPKAEKELWLRGDACPKGAWAIRDNVAGLTILNRFDPGQVAFCYANWHGGQKRVNLEQWSVKARLEPSEALTVRNMYEITTDPPR